MECESLVRCVGGYPAGDASQSIVACKLSPLAFSTSRMQCVQAVLPCLALKDSICIQASPLTHYTEYTQRLCQHLTTRKPTHAAAADSTVVARLGCADRMLVPRASCREVIQIYAYARIVSPHLPDSDLTTSHLTPLRASKGFDYRIPGMTR